MVTLLALHIPDGFLSLHVSGTGWVLMAIALFVALRQMRRQSTQPHPALLGVVAAFIFAAQMINFPVAGGTSGHLLGGTLAAILLGPWAAILVMTLVLGVQALVFQDGGLLALGFNVVNMGVLTAIIGYGIYELLGRRTLAAAVAAWMTVMLAAAATAVQLAISGTSPLNIGLPAMLIVHALIGIGEALITVAALAFVRRAQPGLLLKTNTAEINGIRWAAVGMSVALLVALVSPLASPEPDGLERIAIDQSFDGLAQPPLYEILPDYTVTAIEHEALSTMAAGVLGVLMVAGLGYGLTLTTRRQSIPVRA